MFQRLPGIDIPLFLFTNSCEYCTWLYSAVKYCTALYCKVLYCLILYCTVLYCRTFDGIKPYNYWNGSRFLLDKPVLPEPTQYFGGRVLRNHFFEGHIYMYRQ